MNRKKSTFWTSFWRETGRNSGKFTSNKLFGPTGWATPRRHIIDGSVSSPMDKTRDAEPSDNENIHHSNPTYDWTEDKVERIIEMANEISYTSNDVNDICVKLDDLLTGANTANKFIHSHKMCNKVFLSKINFGIMRLRRINEIELAEFYSNELKKVTRSGNWSKAAPWIIIILAVLGLLLVNYFMGNFDSF
jgi:hypothetical protein